VYGRGEGHTNAVRAAIPWPASPLPIKNLESVLAWDVLHIPGAKFSHLSETVVARPALLGGAVMRMGWDAAIELLGVTQAQQQHPGG
jgi:hypothetical protein